MARKKQDIALQVEIETQEEWEEMLAKEGLTVVDVYQEWCGPCKAVVTLLRRLNNSLGDELLKWAVAKADTIDALEKYRGRCEPCYLFFAGGVLVAVVRGANAPLIQRTVTEQLAHEHKVLDGEFERKEIRDPLIADLEDREKAVQDEEENEKDEEEAEIIRKEVTVAIIKPDAVSAGKADEIIDQMLVSGIEILEKTEQHLTEEEAREFYEHLKDEENFEDIIDFMTSGPCIILVISKGDTGENIIEEWRDMLGPKDVEVAKEEAPESFRAKFGTDKYFNALHGSDSNESSSRELAFFFPEFVAPPVPGSKIKMQRTLALIRPEALQENKDSILQKIAESGFIIAMSKEIQLSKEQAEEFYKEHKDEEYFEELTTNMSSGSVMALALAREDAVTGWRDLLGPKLPPTEEQQQQEQEEEEKKADTLRAQFAVEGSKINPLHGSDTVESAEKELEFFFPMQQTVAVIKPDAYQTKDDIMLRIREAGFHIAARKETELPRDIAEQFYGDHKEKEYFEDLVEHMTSGPTLFMVLSREDAVEGWRGLIGPTDPEKAKEEAPESLRAMFGTDIKSNAIHGSSNVDHAASNIKLVFGELEFNTDGTVQGGDAQEEAEVKQKEMVPLTQPEEVQAEMVLMEREELPPQRALMSTRSEPQPVEMLEAQVIEPLEEREALPTDDAEKQDDESNEKSPQEEEEKKTEEEGEVEEEKQSEDNEENKEEKEEEKEKDAGKVPEDGEKGEEGDGKVQMDGETEEVDQTNETNKEIAEDIVDENSESHETVTEGQQEVTGNGEKEGEKTKEDEKVTEDQEEVKGNGEKEEEKTKEDEMDGKKEEDEAMEKTDSTEAADEQTDGQQQQEGEEDKKEDAEEKKEEDTTQSGGEEKENAEGTKTDEGKEGEASAANEEAKKEEEEKKEEKKEEEEEMV